MHLQICSCVCMSVYIITVCTCACVYVLRCVLGGYAQAGGAGGARGAEEDRIAAGRSGSDDGGAYVCACAPVFSSIYSRSAASSKSSRDT